MKLNSFILGLLLTSSTFLTAQNKVLFKINEKPFYTDEFVRVYNKNLDLVKDESQKEVNNYLDLFVGYKLKVEKAYKEGLDQGLAYQNELKSHRDQLAKNYLNDSEVTQQLLDEAYERYKHEVKASHILLSIEENASEAEVKKIYNKAIEIRNKALKGEDFGKLAQEFSSDPSAKQNQGDLGYFTVFKMVYPFETAAFETAVGAISMPVRTQFGYHIIKTFDKRLNRGEVTVKHIMIAEKDGNTLEIEQQAKDIYKQILAGNSFEELAKNHSNDKSSSTRGGLMAPFRSGDIAFEDFEDQAFLLKNKGDVSQPFKTSLGWHIIKLESKKGIEPFEDVKFQFEGRIARDSRSQKIQLALSDRAKKEYQYQTYPKNIEALTKVISGKKLDSGWDFDQTSTLAQQPVLTINKDKVLNVNDFVKFITRQTKNSSNVKPIYKFVNDSYQKYIDSEIIAYYDAKLESRNPEFKYIVDEYKDGLLIFELLEKDIWNVAKTDTVALQNYYNLNQAKYVLPKRYDAEVFSTKNKKTANKVLKLIKKGKSIDEIKATFNTENDIQVMVRTDVFNELDHALPKPLNDSKKVNGLIQENEYFYIVKINQVLPAAQQTFEEAKQRVISDYQQELEQGWVSRLKSEFDVKLDQEVFNEVKASLNNK
nr:peptidylprolyl isomerase [uncultured Flavobacterium sp.]